MKRSKMIREIVKIVKTWENCQTETATGREILDKIEELGMLPPVIPDEYAKEFDKYEWEPEK